MKKIKKFLNSRLVVAVLFFLFGFYINVYLNHKNTVNSSISQINEDRVPVNPTDFDIDKMHDSFAKNLKDDIENEDSSVIDLNAFNLTPNRKEDDLFVYYEIPLQKNSKNNKLNIEIKDGFIHLKSDSKDKSMSSSMEQVFSIDSNLDDKKAEVLNEKEKVVIKIPKKKV
jgi:hypothetical protein